MQEAHFTRGHLAFARAIDGAKLSWRRAGKELKVTGDHVARVLHGKNCGAETQIKAFQVFGVDLDLWTQAASAEESVEMAALVKAMEERRARTKGGAAS